MARGEAGVFRIHFRLSSKGKREKTWPAFQLVDSVKILKGIPIFNNIIYHCLSKEVIRKQNMYK